ncbi:hypothetical protein [Flavobacterium sp. '19STA2R22 D10 B1']|uniref:hypothetical protein n=1 Tax=Flavobacterium aerium TaxID=3037261 RepID=UPI00278C43BF|nr:hypothetical protein [Flavobacterium sp. '19STA2R22 D10 B1']
MRLKNPIKQSLKIYKNFVDTEDLLKAYFFDNYIVLVEMNDPGYDIVDELKEREVTYRYGVLRINLDSILFLF